MPPLSSSDGDTVDNNLQRVFASILSGGRCSLKEANEEEYDDANWLLLSNVDGDRRQHRRKRILLATGIMVVNERSCRKN